MLSEILEWVTKWKPVLEVAFTAAVVGVGIVQWRVSSKLEALTRKIDERESARLEIRWKHHMDDSFLFAVVNSGRRASSIVDVQLRLSPESNAPVGLRARRVKYDPNYIVMNSKSYPTTEDLGPVVGTVVEDGKLEFLQIEKDSLGLAFRQLGNPSSAYIVVVGATGVEVSQEYQLPGETQLPQSRH